MTNPLSDDAFGQHKRNIYQHTQQKVLQGRINSMSPKKLLIVIGHQGCGNCAHIENTYLELDVSYEDFPIPLQNCGNGTCRALCTPYLLRAIEKYGYKPYNKGTS